MAHLGYLRSWVMPNDYAAKYPIQGGATDPRYLAMSLAVWPSVFIRLAVVMCSASATLRGRPIVVPFAREAGRPFKRSAPP